MVDRAHQLSQGSEAVKHRFRVGLGLAALVAVSQGCVAIDGGAIEIRWDIRDGQGERIGCTGAEREVGLTTLGLLLADTDGGGDPCADQDGCRFDCDGGSDDVILGSTPFLIPEGDYLISSRCLDSSGTALGAVRGVISPPPVLRSIRRGEVAELSVNVIIVMP